VVLPRAEIARLHAALPPHVVLVLDLAYAEYLPPAKCGAVMALAHASDNIVVTRTFSKAYGLAALRVGWAYAPGWMVPALNLLRGVGNVNAPAQDAAIAALCDEDFLAGVVARTAAAREQLAEALGRLGLPYVAGLANFVLTEFPDRPGRRAPDFIAYALAEAGIWLRPVGEPGFADHIRIGLGTEAEMALLLHTLEAFLR
jgi:histidinol-phosphate aminotransferase